MLTAEQFRGIVLRMDGASESAHMSHPDFSANGRVFATVFPDGESGMVKLTPEQQQEFMRRDGIALVPASGAWDRQGCTTVKLAALNEDMIGEAITRAWQNTKKAGVAKRKKKR
jgi:hypothetical protein